MSPTVATFVADTLYACGVRYVFGVPSESLTHLLDAMLDADRPEFVAARHEGGAAFMAEGHAAASGTVGVVLGGRAVGAASLSIGVHTAFENSTPMLVIVGQLSSRHRGREGFQEVDVAGFLGRVAKAAFEESDPARVPGTLRRALALATAGRPGPVVLSLTEDVFDVLTEEKPRGLAEPARPRPSSDEVAAVHRALDGAERPVVVAGAGVLRSGAEDALLRFAEGSGIPVLAGWRRHDVFPNDHPLYAGHLQMGTHPEIVRTLREADLVLALGCRLGEITTQNHTAIVEQHIVQIDIEPAMLGKSHAVELGVVADVRSALQDLLAAGGAAVPGRRHRPDEWAADRRRAYLEATSVPDAPRADAVDSRQIVRMLRAGLPAGSVLTNDAGNFAGWLHTFFRFPCPRTYVGAASGAMGYALPAAVGVRLARPDRPVVAVAGDGGALMTVQEIETAVRLRTPVVLIVLNNNMYASIRMHQERAHPGRVVGSAIGNPDFAMLARSFGAAGVTVRSDVEFGRALADALERDVPSVIEVCTDPERISVWSTITDIRDGAT